jgi:hypothetical protein
MADSQRIVYVLKNQANPPIYYTSVTSSLHVLRTFDELHGHSCELDAKRSCCCECVERADVMPAR